MTSLCITIGACEGDGGWSKLNHVVEGDVVSLSGGIFDAVDDGWRAEWPICREIW